MVHSNFPIVSNGANSSQNIHSKNEFTLKELPKCKKSFLKNNIKLIAAFCFSTLGGSIGGGLLGLAGGIVFTVTTGGAGVFTIPVFVILGAIGGGAAGGISLVPYAYEKQKNIQENQKNSLSFEPVRFQPDLAVSKKNSNDDSDSEEIGSDDEYFFGEKDIIQNKNLNSYLGG